MTQAEELFGRVWEAYGPRLYRFCLLQMKNPADAEDILQDVLVKQKVVEFACGTAKKLDDALGPYKDDIIRNINYVAPYVVDAGGRIANTDEFGKLVDVIIRVANPGINLGKFWTKHNLPGAEFVIKLAIGAIRDDDGVFHIMQNYWQSWDPIGYNDGYDNVFRTAILATGNSMASIKSEEFTVDGVTYMFWSWKGDYMNLGAGAETGIYKKFSDTHYLTAPEKCTDMELKLSWKGKEDDPIFEYKPAIDEEKESMKMQWWITGFDSQTQNVRAEELRSRTRIDFNKMENGEAMYKAFRAATERNEEQMKNWTFMGNNVAIWRW